MGLGKADKQYAGWSGIFACDPGDSTGIAWGLFDIRSGRVSEILAARDLWGSTTIQDAPIAQIGHISDLWRQFYRGCVFKRGIAPIDVHFVMEDFSLHEGSPKGVKLTPVKIAWGVVGHRYGAATEYERCGMGPIGPIRLIWQTPGQKALITDQRLREHELWQVGAVHERDAWRHVVARVAALRSKRP